MTIVRSLDTENISFIRFIHEFGKIIINRRVKFVKMAKNNAEAAMLARPSLTRD